MLVKPISPEHRLVIDVCFVRIDVEQLIQGFDCICGGRLGQLGEYGEQENANFAIQRSGCGVESKSTENTNTFDAESLECVAVVDLWFFGATVLMAVRGRRDSSMLYTTP